MKVLAFAVMRADWRSLPAAPGFVLLLRLACGRSSPPRRYSAGVERRLIYGCAGTVDGPRGTFIAGVLILAEMNNGMSWKMLSIPLKVYCLLRSLSPSVCR